MGTILAAIVSHLKWEAIQNVNDNRSVTRRALLRDLRTYTSGPKPQEENRSPVTSKKSRIIPSTPATSIKDLIRTKKFINKVGGIQRLKGLLKVIQALT